MSHPSGRILVIAAGVVIAVTVTLAVALMGAPGVQRQARIDERCVQDLLQIDAAIQAHARQHDALPASLDAIEPATRRSLALADPETGAAYEYVATGPQRYRLCAVFALDSARQRGAVAIQGWAHPAGRHCFERRVGVSTPR